VKLREEVDALPPWEDLGHRGALVIRSFLTPDEVAVLRADYDSSGLASNKNVNIKHVSIPAIERVRAKLMDAAEQARTRAGVDVDRIVGGGYFAIELGINNEWHADHESYFLLQEHFHYLNFWIPIEKPDPRLSNLSFVPLDTLFERAPHVEDELTGGGAIRCITADGESNIHGDDARIRHVHLDFDINDLAVTPEVEAGDLVLLRGDVFHRTQDVLTKRIAVSFRMVSSKSIVSRQRLLQGGPVKRRMLQSNPLLYTAALRCFHVLGRDEVTVGELLDHLMTPRSHPVQTALSLIELAGKWRMALPPASAFTRSPSQKKDGSILSLFWVGAIDALAGKLSSQRHRISDDARPELRRVLDAIVPSPLKFVRTLAPALAWAVKDRVRRLFQGDDKP